MVGDALEVGGLHLEGFSLTDRPGSDLENSVVLALEDIFFDFVVNLKTTLSQPAFKEWLDILLLFVCDNAAEGDPPDLVFLLLNMVDVAEQAFEAGLVELAVMQEPYNKELTNLLDRLLCFGLVAALRPPRQVGQHPLLIEMPQFEELLLFGQHS